MRSITKRFGAVTANEDIDLTLRRGEIHALVGENGSGKSTLMNQLSGSLQPDDGHIYLWGERVAWRSPLDAIAAGIGMVHQHFQLVSTLTVTENVLLAEPSGWLLSKSERRRVGSELAELGDRIGLGVEPTARVGDLSVGQQQRVEILRALRHGAQILVLDEPTANLAPPEVAQLIERLSAMSDDGMSIVLITHHLNEVIEAASVATVLRSGKVVETVATEDSSPSELARLMVGRDVSLSVVGSLDQARSETKRTGAVGTPALSTVGVSVTDPTGISRLDGVEIDVAPGEIVAVGGVEGNGQDYLEAVLVGLAAPTSGRISLHGDDVTGVKPPTLRRASLSIVPSDRYKHALISEMTIAENAVLDRFGEPPYGHWSKVDRNAINAAGRDAIADFDIRADSETAAAGTLSGGNAQKVVLARALSRRPTVLILGQPTRGLDIAATELVWQTVRAARDSGTAVLLISTDIDEILGLADRALVLFRGQIVASLEGKWLDRPTLGRAMGGLSVAVGQT